MLFNEIVFGPVNSRRLGYSLGINLLPLESKLCNFECLYCECGWRHGNGNETKVQDGSKLVANSFHSREQVYIALKSTLEELRDRGEKIDSITFAGNGEPTMHPFFESIVDDVIALRDSYSSGSSISVLSNSLLASKLPVRRGLMKVDRRILKLDAGNEAMFSLLNQPNGKRQFQKLIETLCSFNGDLEIQSFFVQGTHGGIVIDNTTGFEVASWLDCIKQIHPKKVLIYSLDRPAPATGLTKVVLEELEAIARQVRELKIEAEVF